MKKGRGGVRYEDLKIGEGAVAERGCMVEVRYDLLLNRGDLISERLRVLVRLGERRSIAGLEYGIEGMREGGIRRIRVGPHLAYGQSGIPGVIPQNAVLEFHLDLLRVIDRGEPGDSGMTLYERLYAAGLLSTFDVAGRSRDRAKLIELLRSVDVEDPESSVDTLLANPERYGF